MSLSKLNCSRSNLYYCGLFCALCSDYRLKTKKLFHSSQISLWYPLIVWFAPVKTQKWETNSPQSDIPKDLVASIMEDQHVTDRSPSRKSTQDRCTSLNQTCSTSGPLMSSMIGPQVRNHLLEDQRICWVISEPLVMSLSAMLNEKHAEQELWTFSKAALVTRTQLMSP